MIQPIKWKYPVQVARRYAKLNKKELAKRLNISLSAYERLEKRTQKIRFRTYMKVLFACGLDIGFFWPE